METIKRKKGKTYVAIMDAAMALFWKYGISKTTVEEICEKAGVSKMTFYRKFENKIDVAEKVLVRLAEKGLAEYREIMDSDIPFDKKIQRIVKMNHHNSENLSEDFLRDVYDGSEPRLKNLLVEYQGKSSKALHDDLLEAQKKGEIRQDLKIDFVIYMINGLNEKLLDQRLTSMYGNTQELAVELTNFVFYGIMSREEA
jgi:AcrR family transcriptional regulator